MGESNNIVLMCFSNYESHEKGILMHLHLKYGWCQPGGNEDGNLQAFNNGTEKNYKRM